MNKESIRKTLKEKVACHTGKYSCFHNEVIPYDNNDIIKQLYKLIKNRQNNPKDKNEMIYEISDLIYHLLVLMVNEDVNIEDIKKELKNRKNN